MPRHSCERRHKHSLAQGPMSLRHPPSLDRLDETSRQNKGAHALAHAHALRPRRKHTCNAAAVWHTTEKQHPSPLNCHMPSADLDLLASRARLLAHCRAAGPQQACMQAQPRTHVRHMPAFAAQQHALPAAIQTDAVLQCRRLQELVETVLQASTMASVPSCRACALHWSRKSARALARRTRAAARAGTC